MPAKAKIGTGIGPSKAPPNFRVSESKGSPARATRYPQHVQGGLITRLAPSKGHGERPVGLTVAQVKKAPPLAVRLASACLAVHRPELATPAALFRVMSGPQCTGMVSRSVLLRAGARVHTSPDTEAESGECIVRVRFPRDPLVADTLRERPSVAMHRLGLLPPEDRGHITEERCVSWVTPNV